MINTLTLEEIERALDTGELMMARPCGDFVLARRRRNTTRSRDGSRIAIWLESEVEGEITPSDERMGFVGFKIVPHRAPVTA